jgi:hypothetical protein
MTSVIAAPAAGAEVSVGVGFVKVGVGVLVGLELDVAPVLGVVSVRSAGPLVPPEQPATSADAAMIRANRMGTRLAGARRDTRQAGPAPVASLRSGYA